MLFSRSMYLTPATGADQLAQRHRRAPMQAAWLAAAVLGLCARTAAADLTFDALSPEQLRDASVRCLAVQQSEAADAWRECLVAEAERLAIAPAGADTAELDAASMQTLAPHEADLVRRLCAGSAGNQQVCQTQTVLELDTVPSPDLAALPLERRLSAISNCAAATAADYRTCLNDEAGGPVRQPDDAVQPTAALDTREPSPAVAAARPQNLGEPMSDATPPAETAPDEPGDSLPGTGADADASGSPVGDVIARLQAGYDGLDSTGRTALLATAMLPLLLLLTHLFRGRVSHAGAGPHGTQRNRSLADRVRAPVDAFDEQAATLREAEPMTRDVRARFNRQADDLFDSLDETLAHEPASSTTAHAAPPAASPAASPAANPTDVGSATRTTTPAVTPATGPADPHEAPTVLIGTPPGLREADPEPSSDAMPGSPAVPDDQPASEFRIWLQQQPDTLRRQHTIEFLIYWVAYADERYEPELKASVLTDPEPTDQVRIKRWVLEDDTAAFRDALRWSVLNNSREQRRQTLELLIALLVFDASPTPVQNTLLRFMADCFGIGREGLQAIWQHGFGAPLPDLPRVDRSDWWQQQDQAEMAARDARRIAKADAHEQFAAWLGLPLDTTLEPARIRTACRLAVQRTEPTRFDVLSERERTLAGRQLARFEEARDALLEVMA